MSSVCDLSHKWDPCIQHLKNVAQLHIMMMESYFVLNADSKPPKQIFSCLLEDCLHLFSCHFSCNMQQ